MRMNPATKMMVMSDRYSRANNGNGGGGSDNTDRSGGRATPRTNTERGHTYDRTQDRARDDTRYGRDRNASRSYGYDPDVDVNQRGTRGRDEGEDGEEWRGERQQRQNGRKPQRMYAAGMAWTDDEDEDEEDGDEEVEDEDDDDPPLPFPDYKDPEPTKRMRRTQEEIIALIDEAVKAGCKRRCEIISYTGLTGMTVDRYWTKEE